jgi:hypothetical protein
MRNKSQKPTFSPAVLLGLVLFFSTPDLLFSGDAGDLEFLTPVKAYLTPQDSSNNPFQNPRAAIPLNILGAGVIAEGFQDLYDRNELFSQAWSSKDYPEFWFVLLEFQRSYPGEFKDVIQAFQSKKCSIVFTGSSPRLAIFTDSEGKLSDKQLVFPSSNPEEVDSEEVSRLVNSFRQKMLELGVVSATGGASLSVPLH